VVVDGRGEGEGEERVVGEDGEGEGEGEERGGELDREKEAGRDCVARRGGGEREREEEEEEEEEVEDGSTIEGIRKVSFAAWMSN
jgi:hypothetical protein